MSRDRVGDAFQGLARHEELFEDFCVSRPGCGRVAVNVSIKEPEHVGVAAAPSAPTLAVEAQDDQC